MGRRRKNPIIGAYVKAIDTNKMLAFATPDSPYIARKSGTIANELGEWVVITQGQLVNDPLVQEVAKKHGFFD